MAAGIDPVIERVRRASDHTIEVAGNPFALRHIVGDGATEVEIGDTWPEVAAGAVPADVLALWRAVGSARLFVDVEYGQWGLDLLSPRAARDRTRSELEWRDDGVVEGDVVVGAFLGDQDLLIIDRDGAVLIALPLHPRTDWHRPAASLVDFLEAYLAARGAKFWE